MHSFRSVTINAKAEIIRLVNRRMVYQDGVTVRIAFASPSGKGVDYIEMTREEYTRMCVSVNAQLAALDHEKARQNSVPNNGSRDPLDRYRRGPFRSPSG